MLITLRGGELRHWQAGKGLSAPLSEFRTFRRTGRGGLLDVVLAPDFAQSRRIWLSYSEVGDDGKAGTAVGYGRLSDDPQKWPTSAPSSARCQTVYRQPFWRAAGIRR